MTSASLAANARSILIFITSEIDSAIGENICKLPMLRALRTAAPNARISYVHGPQNIYFKGLLNPFVADLIDEYVEGVRLTEDLFAPADLGPLKGRRFDIVIDTQETAAPMLRLRGLARGGAFVSPFWKHAFSRPRPADARVPRRLPLRLLSLLGAIAPGATPPAAQAPLPAAYAAAARAALPDGPVYIGLAPGAGNKARGKCWPLERFIALAEAQTEAGRAPVMILGPDEAEWLPALRARLPGALFGWPDLTERYAAGLEALPFCTALGARMTAAVTNCAGPGHLLAAGGAAMVCLYGPTNPEKFFPYAARGRWLRAADFGGDRVMEAIPLEAVRAALEAEIAQGRPPPGAPGA